MAKPSPTTVSNSPTAPSKAALSEGAGRARAPRAPSKSPHSKATV
jgi:hypothetical protein